MLWYVKRSTRAKCLGHAKLAVDADVPAESLSFGSR